MNFFQSTNAINRGGVGVAGANVYGTAIIGQQALAMGDLSSIEVHTVSPGGDHNDPLALSFLVGYKVFLGAGVAVTPTAKYIVIDSASSL